MIPFTPVSRDTTQLFTNRYGCQNILLGEAVRMPGTGELVNKFLHGFQVDDWMSSAYNDRITTQHDREELFCTCTRILKLGRI